MTRVTLKDVAAQAGVVCVSDTMAIAAIPLSQKGILLKPELMVRESNSAGAGRGPGRAPAPTDNDASEETL